MNGMRGREMCFCDEKCGKERVLREWSRKDSKRITAIFETKNKGRKVNDRYRKND